MDTNLIDKESPGCARKSPSTGRNRIRRYEGDLAQIESDLADLELDQTADNAELATRLEDLAKLEADLEAGALPLEDIVEFRAKASALKAKTERYDTVLAGASGRSRRANGSPRLTPSRNPRRREPIPPAGRTPSPRDAEGEHGTARGHAGKVFGSRRNRARS